MSVRRNARSNRANTKVLHGERSWVGSSNTISQYAVKQHTYYLAMHSRDSQPCKTTSGHTRDVLQNYGPPDYKKTFSLLKAVVTYCKCQWIVILKRFTQYLLSKSFTEFRTGATCAFTYRLTGRSLGYKTEDNLLKVYHFKLVNVLRNNKFIKISHEWDIWHWFCTFYLSKRLSVLICLASNSPSVHQ